MRGIKTVKKGSRPVRRGRSAGHPFAAGRHGVRRGATAPLTAGCLPSGASTVLSWPHSSFDGAKKGPSWSGHGPGPAPD